MRIFALTVGRDEADRYLEQVLSWTRAFVDGHLYYDDRSTDASIEIADRCGCFTIQRDEADPSFMESESAFRQAAWECLDTVFSPTPDDWVLSIDADEFLMANDDVRPALERAIGLAGRAGSRALNVAINEVFGWDEDDRPLVRVDGFWGQISGVRLVQWPKDLTFKPVELGGGSVPRHALEHSVNTSDVGILHLGYADAQDREAKFARYSQHGGTHNPVHIGSILKNGDLRAWTGKLPWAS